MSPPATWRPLPLRGALPPLLASTRFTSNSYTIHFTDLAHLWTESLDRRPIILRALKEDASIDPSDGEENMASFLKCLKAAFDPSEPMHRLTSVSLSPSSDGAAGEDRLAVTVTCELPKELSSTPLTWHMYLRKQPPEATARELVLPLMESQKVQSERMEELVEVIRQKDALVSKMLDKFEATGTALEHVFTVLGTRKKVSREQAETRVKGLAPFDRAAWEASLGQRSTEDVDALVQGVFGEGMGYNPSAEASHYAEGLGSWWRNMRITSSGPRDVDDGESTVGKRTAPPSSRDESQVKSPQKSPTKSRKPEADDATASETGSEEEAPKPQPTRRLGAIGGAKPRPKATPPDDEETASESDSEAPRETHKESPKKSEPLPLRERNPPGSATASEDEAPPRPSPVKGGRGGLGKIGGITRPRRDVSEDGDSGGEKGEKEETKPERKVLAKPVKKKRKF